MNEHLRRAPAPDLLPRFAAIVGDKYAVTDPAALAPHLIEGRGLYQGRTSMLLRPGSVDEVVAILKLANETKTPLVPQGGNTGLVGGQIPMDGELILSLTRLDKIREVDAASNTMTCEAGVVLQNAQDAAAKVDRLFPLSLGAEGSCTIGGNLSTNAGGTAALAYGIARELVMGLEVVLADGRVMNLLQKLKKDNTGYDLRHIFVGAEGTLGIITAAVLKLFPRPRETETAFIGLPSPAAAVTLLNLARARVGGTVTSFELISRGGDRHGDQARPRPARSADRAASLVRADGSGLAACAERCARAWRNCSATPPSKAWSRTPPSPRASSRRRRSGTCATCCRRSRSRKAARSSTTSRCRSPPSRISWPRRAPRCRR